MVSVSNGAGMTYKAPALRNVDHGDQADRGKQTGLRIAGTQI